MRTAEPAVVVDVERVITLIASELEIDKSRVVPGASLRRNFRVNEADIKKVLMALEIEFGNSLYEADTRQLHTVQDIMNLVANPWQVFE